MPKLNPAQATLSNASAVLTVGSKPAASRRLLTMTAAALLMSAAAFAPQTAQASWYGATQDQSTSARDYGRNETLRTTDGRLAEVVMVRSVEIKNTNRVTLGAAVGAAVGVAAAKDVRNSGARTAARLLLGGLGAAAGQKIQQRASVRDGVEITVMERGSNGRTKLTSVVQSADLPVRPGEVVMLTGSGSRVRVVPLDPEFQARLRGQSAPRAAEQAPQEEIQFQSIQQRRAAQATYNQPEPEPVQAAPRGPRWGGGR